MCCGWMSEENCQLLIGNGQLSTGGILPYDLGGKRPLRMCCDWMSEKNCQLLIGNGQLSTGGVLPVCYTWMSENDPLAYLVEVADKLG